jgi:glycosyltransferase involved in cell wall biosynthesis
MKFDVCMWAKNGEKYLPTVLKRIDSVMPHENVGKKIFVDDSSVDRSVEIAKDFGWNIYHNDKGWINGGTEIALKHVSTEFFASIEQDVFLADNFMSLMKHFECKKTAVACGIYLPTAKYARMYFGNHIKELRKNGDGFIAVGSNFYRTKVIKETGFVTDKIAMVDFFRNVRKFGYDWITDYGVVSEHIRDSFWQDLRHLERLYTVTSCKTRLDEKNVLSCIASVGKSPYYLKTGNPLVMVLEAFVRLKLLEIFLKRRNKNWL